MEEFFLKLCEKLDNEKSKNPTIWSDFMKTSFLQKDNEIIAKFSAHHTR